MAGQIPDFTDSGREIAAMLVERRFEKPVGIVEADSALRLDRASDALAACPTLCWTGRGAHFVVFKVADGHFPTNGRRAVRRWS
ncbi:MAG: hypothetical protein EHM83_04015 [Burkholderiales bacterium]|nr:MAG: hypothetical protein EHM83_04015 [Burkholderiales bacterium]